MQETTTENTTGTPQAAPRTDRLDILKELGRGSVGIVRQARNPQVGRMLALRHFEVPEWLDDVDSLLKRILAEARSASALDHPGIARLYTCGYKGFTIFMTSEFVEGQTLREVMSARTPEMAEVLNWTRQICYALDYAHGKGVFHYFLNPSNIKVLPDGTVKVLDFGLLNEKHLLSQTPAKKLANEPYLSPEQLKGKPVDAAANWFSAAAIVYEMYTARSPFSGKHLGEVDRAITDLNPNPLNMAHPRVPPAVSAVVLRALSKSPRERFSSGQQLVDALENASAIKADPARANAAVAMKPAASSASPTDTGSRSAYNPPAPTADPAATAKVRPLPSPTATRVQVGTGNHWKVVGGVVACLVVVAGLAALFQRKPAETSETTAPPPKAARKVVARQTPTQAPAPDPAPAAVAEQTPADIQPLQTFATPSVLTSTSKRGRGRAAKTAAPVVPSTPQQGELSVSSTPEDATIEIEGMNGQSWKTPQVVGALTPGSYKITVSKPGYGADVRTVQVSAGNRANLDIRLTAVKGWLTIAGSPAGASVLIDGKDTGRVTPVTLMLDPATHAVSIRKTGFLNSDSQVQLSAGQSTSYSPTLMVAGRTDNIHIMGGGMGKIFGGGSSQGKARIEIKSEPKGAQVIINGTPLQKTTPVEIQVEAGNYDILLQKDGYKAVHENAIVGTEDRIKIAKTLER